MSLEKTEGCSHVKCPVEWGGCGYDFCWRCEGMWPRCGCGEAERMTERVVEEERRKRRRF